MCTTTISVLRPTRQQHDEEAVSSSGKSHQPHNESTRIPLALALREGTAVVHLQAEQVHFVRNFFRGDIAHDVYAQFLGSLYHIYAGLERFMEEYGPKHFPTCHFPTELGRTQALEEDLDFWLGHRPRPAPSPATLDFVARLQHIAHTNPLLLLAHAYTRYMGDLSGGKLLARVAEKALGVTRDAGLDFYQFEHVPSAKRFKDKYRRALNELNLTTDQIHELVEEANISFMLNIRVFEEMDVYANVPGATVRSLENAMTFARMQSNRHHQPELVRSAFAVQACPFLENGSSNNNTDEKKQTQAASSCPWPFTVFHRPEQFLCDWKTWALLLFIGFVLGGQYWDQVRPTFA